MLQILKEGLRGGLTCVYRTLVANNDDTYEPYVKLLEEQLTSTRNDDQEADVEMVQGIKARIEACDGNLLEYLKRCNAHLISPEDQQSEPSLSPKAVLYFDFNSLYVASGKLYTLIISFLDGVLDGLS